jgi:hypothetical protein
MPPKDALGFRALLETRLAHIHARVVVFNGHIHNYERFERKGVEYVVTGGGGAKPYPLYLRGRADLYRDSAFPVYHYLTVEVGDHKLHAVMFKVRNPDASTLEVEAKDQFTLTASAEGPAVKPKSKSRAGVPAH